MGFFVIGKDNLHIKVIYTYYSIICTQKQRSLAFSKGDYLVYLKRNLWKFVRLMNDIKLYSSIYLGCSLYKF